MTVTGVDDAKADGDVAYQVVFASPTSADSAYASLAPPAPVALTNVDDDAVGVLVTPTTCTTNSGTTATFTIRLSSQPSADVSISLTSDTPSEGTVAPASVTFTSGNWAAPQAVTVTGGSGTMGTTAPYNIVTADAVAPGETTGYNGFSNVPDVACTNTTPAAPPITPP